MASSDLPPMPTPTLPPKPFTSFKLVSFDIFGTLVDDSTGLLASFSRLASQIPESSEHAHFKNIASVSTKPSTSPAPESMQLALFAHHTERNIQNSNPDMRHDKVLEETYRQVAKSWGIKIDDQVEKEAATFGQSMPSWPAFTDTVAACQTLAKYYHLVPVSNVDNATFKKVCEASLKGAPFWRIFTAEDIGSYKPDLNNFHYLIKNADEADKAEGGKGITKDDILHVAHSLPVDHVPTKKLGMSSVWIRRGEDVSPETEGGKLHAEKKVGYGWRFETLGELAQEVEKAFETEVKGS